MKPSRFIPTLLVLSVFLFSEMVAQPSGGGWSKNVSLLAKGIPGRSGASSDVSGWRDSQTGKDYVLVTIDNNLSIVETTNPSTPVERVYITGIGVDKLGTPDVEVYESGGNAYAYLARNEPFASGYTAIIINIRQALAAPGGIVTIDVNGSFNSVFVGRIPGVTLKMERGHTLTIAGGILYICPAHRTIDGPDIHKSYFDVWDLRTNPASPTHIGLYQAVFSSTSAAECGLRFIICSAMS